MRQILIIGAGPAGMSAAMALAEAGIRPIVFDENTLAGGQGFRQTNPDIDLDADAIYGREYGRYRDLHSRFRSCLDKIDYRSSTLVWAIHDRKAHTFNDKGFSEIAFDGLILAPGATDRLMPLPGWTLPGVFSLGAAQVALKDQGCFIGRRIVFAGSSPLLLLAALQYHKLGARQLCVLDTTPLHHKLRAAPGLLNSGRTFLQGLSYLWALKKRGVPIHNGVELREIEGQDRVTAIRFSDTSGTEHRLTCDAVALGYGLRAETQLAELAGADFRFDHRLRQWLPRVDENGRAGDCLYIAGDGAATGGAYAAIASGTLAATALLGELGMSQAGKNGAHLQTQVGKLRRFQQHLAAAFRWPHETAQTLPGHTIVCRCENVTADDIRTAARQAFGPVELNRMKAITRCGMGRCQGRFCSAALAEIAAAACGKPIDAVGRLRAQAPVKPVPISTTETALR